MKNNSPQWNRLLLKLSFSVTLLIVKSAFDCTQWGVTANDGGREGRRWRVTKGHESVSGRHSWDIFLGWQGETIICACMRKLRFFFFVFFCLSKSDREQIMIMHLQPLHWHLQMKKDGNVQKVTLGFFFSFFLNCFGNCLMHWSWFCYRAVFNSFLWRERNYKLALFKSSTCNRVENPVRLNLAPWLLKVNVSTEAEATWNSTLRPWWPHHKYSALEETFI